MLILREGPAALPPHLRLLCWTTQAVGAAVLALALLSRQLTGCAHLRPYVLVAARLLSDVLFPHVVWQMASSDSSRGGKSDEDESASWTGAGYCGPVGKRFVGRHLRRPWPPACLGPQLFCVARTFSKYAVHTASATRCHATLPPLQASSSCG